eukprot:1746416-Rhodomonas_salina.1
MEFTLQQDFYQRDTKQWMISCSDHCKAKASYVTDGFVTGSNLMEGIIIDGPDLKSIGHALRIPM